MKTLLESDSFSIKTFSKEFAYGFDKRTQTNRMHEPVGSQLFPITRNKEQI